MNRIHLILLITLPCVYSSVFASSILSGTKTITLSGADNEQLEIGLVHFKNENGRVMYEIEFKEGVFSDEFLSMRPFRCIHKTGQMLCHLVYPYKKQGYISEKDLTDLEYDLLFLHKTIDEYGINPWNGLYYDLKLGKQGIEGFLKEVDLNVLVAPPDDGVLRPITEDMLYDADSANHLFQGITIK